MSMLGVDAVFIWVREMSCHWYEHLLQFLNDRQTIQQTLNNYVQKQTLTQSDKQVDSYSFFHDKSAVWVISIAVPKSGWCTD